MSPRLSVRRRTPPLAPANVQMEPTKLPGFKNCNRFIHSAHSNSSKFDPLGNCWPVHLEGQGLGRECLGQCHVTHPCVSSVSFFRSFFRFQGPHWIQWFIPWNNGTILSNKDSQSDQSENQRVPRISPDVLARRALSSAVGDTQSRKSLNVYSKEYLETIEPSSEKDGVWMKDNKRMWRSFMNSIPYKKCYKKMALMRQSRRSFEMITIQELAYTIWQIPSNRTGNQTNMLERIPTGTVSGLAVWRISKVSLLALSEFNSTLILSHLRLRPWWNSNTHRCCLKSGRSHLLG